jgi:hypothetical protein
MPKAIEIIDKAIGSISLIPPDKLGHFTGGVATFVVLHVCDLVIPIGGIDPSMSQAINLGVVVLSGVGKEVYDFAYNKLKAQAHTVDIWDAVATSLGGLAGFICTVQV